MIEKVTALSDIGLRREDNQDAVLAVYTKEAGLFAVADGMGGCFGGGLASQAVVSALEKWWKGIETCISAVPFSEIVSELERKVQQIHSEVLCMYQEMGQCGGTTLCMLFIHFDTYVVMNVGDSRCYKCQGRICRQLTVDDVWENQFSRTDRPTREELRKDRLAGSLVQAVGAQEKLRLAVASAFVEKRACFLLCSDGIYKYSENSWLMWQLRRSLYQRNVDGIAEKIRRRVYQNGARDNLSLILVLMDSGDRG